MSKRKPLVLADDASFQQLQSPDDLNIPLAVQVSQLQADIDILIFALLAQGIELPGEIINGNAN